MLEIVSILASLVIIVLAPIQTAQICAGKISKKYKGTREEYAALFDKQFRLMFWLGIVFGVLNLGLMFTETEPGEWVVKLVAALLWFGVSVSTFISRRKLAHLPAIAAGG